MSHGSRDVCGHMCAICNVHVQTICISNIYTVLPIQSWQKLLRGVKFGCFHGSDTHNNTIIGKSSITNTPIGRTLKLNYKTSRVPIKLHRSNIFQCAHTHTYTGKHVTQTHRHVKADFLMLTRCVGACCYIMTVIKWGRRHGTPGN